MSLALYRKYRPKLLSDLLGQEMTVQILMNAARQDRLAHAYLFYGPRGSGKTSAARIVAKTANCEARAKDEKFREKGEPCNKCQPCAEIDAGRALDVLEIDAASNRGIDEIRDLQAGIRLSPMAYRYKVYIIDEVHQLSKDAFNALLKTLEEPPAHAIFILATTEFEKVPPTIFSRTQRFQFKKLEKGTILGKLATIVKTEKLDAEPEALELIAASADGSLRDAESMLDQIAASAAKITLEATERTLGRFAVKRLNDFATLLVNKDLPGALTYIKTLEASGDNLVQFTKDLIHYFRRTLSLKADPNIATLFARELTTGEIEMLKVLSAAYEMNALIALMKSLIKSYSEMRYTHLAAVPLEIAIIENLKPAKKE